MNTATSGSQSEWRVFGDAATFRRKLRERVRNGRLMADELLGARERLTHTPDGKPRGLVGGLLREVKEAMAVQPFESRLESWQRGNTSLLRNHLGKAAEGVVGKYHNADIKANAASRIDSVEAAIASDISALDELLGALGPGRRTNTIGPVGIRLDELEASGLLDPEVIEAFRQRMSQLGTRRGVSASIGAAKELVEAVHKAALGCLDEPPPKPRDDFLLTAKRVRMALDRKQPAPDANGGNTLLHFQIHQAGLLQDLDEWRNLFGDGHGRTSFPRALATRHGRLAIDIAETYVRFLVTTLGDLGLLGGMKRIANVGL